MIGRHLARASVAVLVLLPTGAAVAQQAPEHSSRCPQTQGAGTSGQYPPNRGALQLSRSAARRGEPVTSRGCGFRPGSTVNVDFFSQPTRVATATAGADGGFEATFNIPANAAIGQHTVEATGVDPAGDVRALSANIRVVGAEQGRGGDLPRTGSDSTAPLVTAGAGLVLLGGAAVFAARRRRAARVEA